MEDLIIKLVELGGMTAGFFLLLRQTSEMYDRQSETLERQADTLNEQAITMGRISSTLTHLETRIDKMEGDIMQLKDKGQRKTGSR